MSPYLHVPSFPDSLGHHLHQDSKGSLPAGFLDTHLVFLCPSLENLTLESVHNHSEIPQELGAKLTPSHGLVCSWWLVPPVSGLTTP